MQEAPAHLLFLREYRILFAATLPKCRLVYLMMKGRSLCGRQQSFVGVMDVVVWPVINWFLHHIYISVTLSHQINEHHLNSTCFDLVSLCFLTLYNSCVGELITPHYSPINLLKHKKHWYKKHSVSCIRTLLHCWINFTFICFSIKSSKIKTY